MLIAVLMFCVLGVYILSPHLKSGHFNRTPGRWPTFATFPPPLVAFDSTLRFILVACLLPQQSRTLPITFCDEVMSMQWGYYTNQSTIPVGRLIFAFQRGWGAVLPERLGGPTLKTLTLFMTKFCIFSYLFITWPKLQKPIYDCCTQLSQHKSWRAFVDSDG